MSDAQHTKLTVLFAGGGTGGHLFPALAVAEELVSRAPGVRVRFLCSTRPLDAEILRAETLLGAPVEFEAVAAAPFVLRPRGMWKFVASWGGAVRAGRAAIRAAKAHGAVKVVSGGGFVAAPVVQAARAERVPVIMLNLDAAPGRANQWISRHAAKVFTTAPVERAEWTMIPPIVRKQAVAPGTAAECRVRFGLLAEAPTLLVTGASQGATSINVLMAALAGAHADALAGWQVIHQTGKSDVEETRAAYRAAGVRAIVEPFIREMGAAWGAADLAVSRAGAGSVAEAWANRVPTVFLPYPYHKDEHQRKNAAPLADAGAAVVVKDRVGVTDNMREVAPVIVELLRDSAKREGMRRALEKLGPADGAAKVAEALVRG